MDIDLEHTSTIDILTEMAELEQSIDMAILRYEKLRQEITRRFPPLLEEPAFSENKYKTKTL